MALSMSPGSCFGTDRSRFKRLCSLPCQCKVDVKDDISFQKKDTCGDGDRGSRGRPPRFQS